MFRHKLLTTGKFCLFHRVSLCTCLPRPVYWRDPIPSFHVQPVWSTAVSVSVCKSVLLFMQTHVRMWTIYSTLHISILLKRCFFSLNRIHLVSVCFTAIPLELKWKYVCVRECAPAYMLLVLYIYITKICEDFSFHREAERTSRLYSSAQTEKKLLSKKIHRVKNL